MAEMKLAAYSIKHFKDEGTGRQGIRWSATLYQGKRQIALINEDGDGGCLRWCWPLGPVGAEARDRFRDALARWVQEAIPGSVITEYVEPEGAFVQLVMSDKPFLGTDAVAALEMYRRRPEPTRPPNWETLKNRLEIMVHCMKLGHSSLLSLGVPNGDILNSQAYAIKTVERWIREGMCVVDSWKVLNNDLCGIQAPHWVCYNHDDRSDHVSLGFGCFAPVQEWNTKTAKPIRLAVFHREPIYGD